MWIRDCKIKVEKQGQVRMRLASLSATYLRNPPITETNDPNSPVHKRLRDEAKHQEFHTVVLGKRMRKRILQIKLCYEFTGMIAGSHRDSSLQREKFK